MVTGERDDSPEPHIGKHQALGSGGARDERRAHPRRRPVGTDGSHLLGTSRVTRVANPAVARSSTLGTKVAASGELTRLLRGQATQPDWSPDGHGSGSSASSRVKPLAIWSVKPDGSDPRQIDPGARPASRRARSAKVDRPGRRTAAAPDPPVREGARTSRGRMDEVGCDLDIDANGSSGRSRCGCQRPTSSADLPAGVWSPAADPSRSSLSTRRRPVKQAMRSSWSTQRQRAAAADTLAASRG